MGSVGSVGTTTTFTEEEDSVLELTEDSKMTDIAELQRLSKLTDQSAKIRMKKVDLEKIYPQAEKDREGDRLRRLCEIQEGQKLISCDGMHLLREFVKPRQLQEMDLDEAENKIKHSLKRSPEGHFFLNLIDRQASTFIEKQ